MNSSTSTATYAGIVDINLTNTHPSTAITLGGNGTSTYNGDIIVSSNSGVNNGIYFNSGTGNSTLAASRIIAIGAGGFSAGILSLPRFTQVGATTQTLTAFSGTARLIVGPASSFGGNVDFRAPQLNLNGCTYNGTAMLEKNSATDNSGSAVMYSTGLQQLRTVVPGTC